MSMSVKAKVFVSCGQAVGSGEVDVARCVAANLVGLGFDPYVAVEEQTLRGLKEDVFAQLADSEYFVFIDFKREALSNSDPAVHRGSLFSHQELALATFLDIPVIALQEAGVKRDDGILRFVQANAYSSATVIWFRMWSPSSLHSADGSLTGATRSCWSETRLNSATPS